MYYLYFQMMEELFLGLKSSITRGWQRNYMFCKYGNFKIFFDLHCNHWPFVSMSCNVLIMDVVWSFCYIYKRQATDQREIEKIRVTVVMRGREEDILHHWNVCRKVCKNIFRINVFVITFLSQGVYSWNICLHVSI